jgi:hypothetical protein
VSAERYTKSYKARSFSMTQEFREKLKAYEKLILYADACNNNYFLMKYGDKKWEEAYKIAPAFFGLAIKSFQSEAFLTICKLFEIGNRSDNNFTKLLNFVETNAKLIDGNKVSELNQIVKKYRESIKSCSHIIEKILSLRDKIIAHSDNKYFTIFENKADDIDLSYEEVAELINLAGEIVNSFNRVLNDSITYMKYQNSDDIRSLMSFCLTHLKTDKW